MSKEKKDGAESTCKSCKKVYYNKNKNRIKENNKIYYYKHIDKIKNRYIKRSSTLEGFLKKLVTSSRCNAKRQGVPHKITFKILKNMFIYQKGKCAISDADMTHIAGRGIVQTNISIDRITPELGYILENTRLTCLRANIMKYNQNDSELIRWCKAILFAIPNAGKVEF